MSSNIASSSLFLLPPDNTFTISDSATNGTKTILTVPAGQTAFITGVELSSSTNITCTLEINSVQVWQGANGANENVFFNGYPFAIANAGEDIDFTVPVGTGYINIWGFYQ